MRPTPKHISVVLTGRRGGVTGAGLIARASSRRYLVLPPDPSPHLDAIITTLRSSGRVVTVSETPSQILETSRLGFDQVVFAHPSDTFRASLEAQSILETCMENGVRVEIDLITTWHELRSKLK